MQLFSEEDAARWDFDVLDATKFFPEDLVPVRRVGRLTLDRDPDSYFAATEQVAFKTPSVVPEIGFSDAPLLQGRNFSCLDTQFSRLGSPNFHGLPINRSVAPVANNQRDAHSGTPSTAGASRTRRPPWTGTRPRRPRSSAAVTDARIYANAASVLYDGVYVPGGPAATTTLRQAGDGREFVSEAYKHGTPIALSTGRRPARRGVGGGRAAARGRATGADLRAGVVVLADADGGAPRARRWRLWRSTGSSRAARRNSSPRNRAEEAGPPRGGPATRS